MLALRNSDDGGPKVGERVEDTAFDAFSDYI